MQNIQNVVLPTQQEIMANWADEGPLVSIICITYNHERYIEDAIRGFLVQETNFPFEIIIHDDASTDSTRSIIEAYARLYPALIIPVFQSKNQYSQGVRVMLHAAGYAAGQYIALCEGDDFWISPGKLQTQVDALRRYHPAIKVANGKPEHHLFCKRAEGIKLISASEIIRCGGSFMPTGSMLIRRSFFDRVNQHHTSFYKRHLTGYFYQIFCSLRGGALYIDRPMSVYRYVSSGSWTERMVNEQAFYKQWLTNYLSSLREANLITEYKFAKDFAVPIRRCHLSVLNKTNLDLSFRRGYFSKNKKEIGMLGTIMWYLIFCHPRIHSIMNRMRIYLKGRCAGLA